MILVVPLTHIYIIILLTLELSVRHDKAVMDLGFSEGGF